MAEEHFVGKVANKGLLEKDGKVLLVKTFTDAFWDIPGGRINRGEKPKQAVVREFKEELGVDVTVGQPFFADLIIAKKTGEERYFVCFRVELIDPSQSFTTDPSEAEEMLWVGKNEVETVAMYDVCRDTLREYFK